MLFSYKYYVTYIPNDDTRYVTANTFIYFRKVQILKSLISKNIEISIFEISILDPRFSTKSSQWERKHGSNITTGRTKLGQLRSLFLFTNANKQEKGFCSDSEFATAFSNPYLRLLCNMIHNAIIFK